MNNKNLREDEIRPDALYAGQLQRMEADLRRLLNSRNAFKTVACPACSGWSSHIEFNKHSLNYLSCEDCETLYVSPRPTPPILEDFYSGSENYAYWNNVIFPASEQARREKIFKPRVARLLDLCRQYGIRTHSLLEVGAGFGTFGTELKATGVFERVVVVEPTPNLAKTCRERGLEVIESPVAQADLAPATFDVVVAFEVIEHLYSPSEFIAQCGRLLRPGGLLMLTCPNAKGFDIAMLGPLSKAVDYEHINYFHPKSLARLATSLGYEVLEVQTPGRLDAELVRKSILSGEFDVSTRPFLRRVLVDEWDDVGANFQEFLVQNGMSSNMWLVAKKGI